MRIFRVRWVLVLAAVLAQRAFPGIRPSFSLDYSSWHATDVVLATTTSADGTFEVAESWKGDLHAGERLVIPELIPDLHAIPISRYPKSGSAIARGGPSELIPKEPVGSRMVLFLKSVTDEGLPHNRTDIAQHHRWKPADMMDTMKASVVWIDDGRLYSFDQPINPGPSVLSVSRYSERDLQGRVAEIRSIQENMTAALAAGDGEERALRLKPYVRSDVLPAQMLALEELGMSGPSAVQTIRGMLDDSAFSDQAPELVKALVEAGGATVSEDLSSRLRLDLAFWRSTGPSLSQDWWNEDVTPHSPLRRRYAQTYQLIVALEQTHHSASLNTAIQLRDLWRSLPQLSEFKQLPEACDKLIAHLKTN